MPEQQLRMIRSHFEDLPDLDIPEGYELRAYRPGDEAAWAGIMNTGLGSGWTAERCEEELTGLPRFRPDGLFFVTRQGEPVGSACAWPDAPDDYARAQVHMVCVKPEHRGRRLGRVLCVAVLRYMRDHGFQSAYLTTDDFRLAAVKEYFDLGFEPDYVEESHRARWARVIAELGLTARWWRHARPEPAAWQPRDTEGNRALLVLVDRNQREAYDRARRTVIAALSHLHVPYRVLDLASAREPAYSMMSHQAVVLAQERIGDSIPEVLARRLAEAVHGGLGLVSYDHRIDRFPGPLFDALPIEGLTGIVATDRVSVPASDHFIVRAHEAAQEHRCRQPVELTGVDVAEHGEALLETRERMAALVAGRFGAGRVAQFLVSPAIWTAEGYGHCEGLDDVFWKSLVWVSRKPFVMKAMPPFMTAHVSGASGAANGFAWVKPLLDHGWRPHIGILTEEIHAAEWKTVAALSETHHVAWFPEGLTARRGAVFHHVAHRPYSDEEIEAGLAQASAALERHGVPPARTMTAHHDEYGRNALAPLQAWGVRYSVCPFLPGESAEETHLNWEPAPYGHPGYVLDTLFGHPGLFVAAARPVSRRRIIDGYRYATDRAVRDEADCLSGKQTDTETRIEEAAQTAARLIRRGLDSRFFGVLSTRESSIDALGMEAWTRFLDRLDELLAGINGIRVSQDFISEYARSHVDTRLARVDYTGETDELHLTLSGRATVPLHIQVFDNDCRERTIALEAFDGEKETRVRVSEWAR